MIRTSGWLTLAALTLSSSSSGAGNQVTWSLHIGETAVSLPAALFDNRVLPVTGTRWRCVADKILRQDVTGNTFNTLTVRCDDGESTVSASASCAIGAHDSRQLSFELLERTTGAKSAIRAGVHGRLLTRAPSFGILRPRRGTMTKIQQPIGFAM